MSLLASLAPQALSLLLGLARADAPPAEPMAPRLVVLVVIDQCRRDYFDRFAPRFDGFFARLRDEGRWFTDGEQHHALTVTAAGHAAIGTGRFPCHNGIVGNDFFDPDEDQLVGATNDDRAKPVGGAGGGFSAKRLRCDGLGDWWKKQWPSAKTLGVSIKPRSAILPLGQHGGAAFWVDERSGALVTSDWFAQEVPAWSADFNAHSPIESYPQSWETTLSDAAAYAALGCTGDDQEGEVPSGPKRTRTFPHSLAAPNRATRTQLVIYSPWGDQLVLDFARRAIEAGGLGADDVPDLLVLGLSATDLIGHRYGPDSWEICEQLLHLDRALGDFFDFVDEKVGAEHLLVALSSDHGVCPLPEVAQAAGKPGARIDWTTLQPGVDAALRSIAPELADPHGAVVPISEFGIRLRPEFVASTGHALDEVADALAAKLRATPPFVDARSHHELQQPLKADDRVGDLLRASSDGVRAGDLLFVLPAGSIYVPPPATVAQIKNVVATSHGTPYAYDTAVPIVFFGAGVGAGRVAGRAWTVDIAPTLARAAQVKAPADLDGKELPLANER